jgi:hypothetical protein
MHCAQAKEAELHAIAEAKEKKIRQALRREQKADAEVSP